MKGESAQTRCCELTRAWRPPWTPIWTPRHRNLRQHRRSLKARPELAPWRLPVRLKPKVSAAEMLTLAMVSVMLGFDDEARWVRHVRVQWRHVSPYVRHQPGYNKQLRLLWSVPVT